MAISFEHCFISHATQLLESVDTEGEGGVILDIIWLCIVIVKLFVLRSIPVLGLSLTAKY